MTIQKRPATIFVDVASRAILDLCEIDGQYWIARINVPAKHRRLGVGAKLLQEALAEYDRVHVSVRLLADPSGEMTREQLVAWYEKFGFRQMPEEVFGFMVRDAR